MHKEDYLLELPRGLLLPYGAPLGVSFDRGVCACAASTSSPLPGFRQYSTVRYSMGLRRLINACARGPLHAAQDSRRTSKSESRGILH